MAGTGKAHLRPADQTLLRVEDLVVEFPVGRSGLKVNAVTGISLDLIEGETLGLVGESGCGKSTTGRAIMQLPRPTSGTVVLEDQDITQLSGEDVRKLRPRMQMIFQDPKSSLGSGNGSGANDQSPGHPGAGRHRPGSSGKPQTPRIFRRSMSAHLHRPSGGHGAESHHL
jgi:ABC-type oligopeptide transport system ATPase subunit